MEQAKFFHEQKGGGCLALPERSVGLLDQPRDRGFEQISAMALDSVPRRRFDLEAKLRGESNRAHHPDRILAHPHFRLADGPDESAEKIVNAAGVVDHAKGLRIIKQRVDGKVASKRVFL